MSDREGPAAPWPELRELLARALEAGEAERDRIMAELERTDPARARALADLLRADALSGSFLDAGVAPLVRELAAAPAAGGGGAARGGCAPGERLGAWRLGPLLGQGGMGTVFEAERADGVFGQSAAIKVLRAGVGSPDLAARFVRERQLLARLEHPAIVKLLDGGVTDHGLPWLALERVTGAPITRFAADRGLSPRQRVELLLEVCDAVDAAHRQLVIHRDLKPSNILVTPEGRVKLLDFGIAKVVAEDAQGDATRTEARLLTPQYAAPEQILGAPSTTAVDVYALGVVLYELLTGTLPHQRSTTSPAALATEVTRETVTPPSRRLAETGSGDAAHRLRARDIAGDLDAIALKALRSEPNERYGSVAELGADLRRYLGGHPVAARAGARGYRARRFVRRHRLEVVGGSLLAAALVAGLVSTTWQARIATRERDRARVEAETARQVSSFLAALFQTADPGRTKGAKLTAREVLDRGAQRIDKDLASQPEVQATLLTLLGAVYRDLGQLDEARPLLERALALRERLRGPDHLETAEVLYELAYLERLTGDVEAARPRLEHALAIRERDLGSDHPDVARTLSHLGIIHRLEGDSTGAVPLLERAVAIAQRHPAARAESGKWLSNLGLAYQDLGDLAAARRAFERGVAILEREEGPDSPVPSLAMDNLGMILRSQGEFDAALPVLQRAKALVERTWGTEHPQYGTALNSLGSLLGDMGREQEAIPLLRRAAEVYTAALGPGHAFIAYPLENEGDCWLALGRPADALPLFERALEIRESALGSEHPQVAWSLTTIGRTHTALGNFAEAETHLRRGLKLLRDANEPDSMALADSLAALGDCLAHDGRPVEARAFYEEALPIRRRALPPGHTSIRAVENALERLATEAS